MDRLIVDYEDPRKSGTDIKHLEAEGLLIRFTIHRYPRFGRKQKGTARIRAEILVENIEIDLDEEQLLDGITNYSPEVQERSDGDAVSEPEAAEIHVREAPEDS